MFSTFAHAAAALRSGHANPTQRPPEFWAQLALQTQAVVDAVSSHAGNMQIRSPLRRCRLRVVSVPLNPYKRLQLCARRYCNLMPVTEPKWTRSLSFKATCHKLLSLRRAGSYISALTINAR